jgi:hypothetical protein
MSETLGQTLAMVIAGVVVLTIVATSFRGQEASVSSLDYRMVKQSTVELAGFMERDFRNIGSNYPYPDVMSDLAVIGFDTVSTIRKFVFSAQTVRGQLPDTVRYEWTAGPSKVMGDSTYATVTVKRFVNDTLRGVNSGAITHFSLELRTATGGPVMAAAETRQVVVEMRSVSALGGHGKIRESRWSDTIHPMHLAKQDGIF